MTNKAEQMHKIADESTMQILYVKIASTAKQGDYTIRVSASSFRPSITAGFVDIYIVAEDDEWMGDLIRNGFKVERVKDRPSQFDVSW